jgi:hypothetical protein
MADILIGGPQFMLEQLQGEQDTEGNGPATTGGFFRKPGNSANTLTSAAQERCQPTDDRMHDGDKIRDLQAGSVPPNQCWDNAQRITDSPAARGNESHRIRRDAQLTSPSECGKLVTTNYRMILVQTRSRHRASMRRSSRSPRRCGRPEVAMLASATPARGSSARAAQMSGTGS